MGKQSFWIMALHFTAFKIGSVLLGLFVSGVSVSVLTPVATNSFQLLFYSILGIILPCAVGVIIEKCKRNIIRRT